MLGALIWSVAFGAFGYGVGAGLKAVLARRGHAEELLLAGVAAAMVYALLMHRRVRKRHAQASGAF